MKSKIDLIILGKFGNIGAFADKLGISLVSLSAKRKNLNNLKLSEVRKWCEYLDISLTDFIRLSDK